MRKIIVAITYILFANSLIRGAYFWVWIIFLSKEDICKTWSHVSIVGLVLFFLGLVILYSTDEEKDELDIIDHLIE